MTRRNFPIMERWIRLNDDICLSCNQPKFIWLEFVETGLNIIVTCSCPSCTHNPYGTPWAQMDNISVARIMNIYRGAIEHD